MASITGGDASSTFRARVAHVVQAVREAFTARPAAPIVSPEDRERGVRDATLRTVGATFDRLASLRRAAAGGQAPPVVPGAGWDQSLDPVWADGKQAQLWASAEAKFGRVTTSYGMTPQAFGKVSSSALTLERIAQVHDECDYSGLLVNKADVDFYVNRSTAQIQMAHRARIAPLYRSRLEVAPADRTPLAWAVAALVRKVLDKIPGLQKAEEDLASAAAHGYSGLEVVYSQPDDLSVAISSRRTVTFRELRGVASLEWIHPRDFRWHPVKRSMALDAGGGRYIDPFVGPDGALTRKLIFHSTSGQGDPHQRGYDWAAVPLAMLGKQSFARWAVLLEYFGVNTPYLVWDEENYASPEDTAAALAFLGALGRGIPAFLPRKVGEGLKNTETPTGIDARGQHAAILGYVAAELSKLVMGQTLSAEAGGSGSYALANVQSDSKEEVQCIDASLEADTMTHQLVVYVIEENLPAICRALGATPEQIRAVCPRAYRIVDRRQDPAARLKLCLDYEGRDSGGQPAQGRRRVDWDRVAAELAIPLSQDEPGEDVPAIAEHKEPVAVEEKQPEPAQVKTDAAQPKIELTPSDVATIVTVDEGRNSMGLAPLAEDGKLTIAEFKAKHADAVAAAAAAQDGQATPASEDEQHPPQ